MGKYDVRYERELRDIKTKEGWLIIRSAGSLKEDLIALKPKDHEIIEVKSVKSEVYYTTKDKEQFDSLNELAKKGYNVFYYIRWKGKKSGKQWSRFKLPLAPYPVFKFEESN